MKQVAELIQHDKTCSDLHHVDKACRLLVAEVERDRPGHRARAVVVDRRRRTHSMIHIIQVESGDGDARRFYLKTLNSAEGERSRRMTQITTEYGMLSELCERFTPFNDLGVVKPVACLPEDLALITEEFAGDKLDVVLAGVRLFQSKDELERSAQLCGLVGSWLHHFQGFTARLGPDRYDMTELFDYCEERLRIIADGRNSEIDAGYSERILAHLEWLAGRIDENELELTGRQNDYRPDNMVTRNGRLAVLDFTGFTHGPRLYDFMKFWMRLDYYAFGPLAAPDKIDRLKERFVEGYGRPVDVQSPLAEFLRVANILDKMSELAEAPPRSWRRLLDHRWFRYLQQQVEVALGRP